MLAGLLIRNIKNYGNLNFIPICNCSYMYSVFVGNNGVGKSAVLEAIDVFFNEKEWNTTTGMKRTEAYICPVFLISKKSITNKNANVFEAVSEVLWNVQASTNPNFEKTEALRNFLVYRDELVKSYKEDYYLILVGIQYENFKKAYFASFEALIARKFEEKQIDESKKDLLLNMIRDMYDYIYVPVEENPSALLRLQNITMQKLLNKNILNEIERALNKKINGTTLIAQITKNLDDFINDINGKISEIDNKYCFESELAGRKNLTAKDLRDKVLDAYFPLRTLKVNGRNVSLLSSGEQRKAIIDIAYSILAANELRKTEKDIILAIDEPEMSMHISNCFDQFSRLEEVAREFKKQVLLTSHWYGFLPIAQNGNMHYIDYKLGETSIRSFSLFNYTEERRNYPDVIELKSMYDLATALITYMRLHDNCKWIICEGTDDKIYLQHILDNNPLIKILPVCGCGNVIKLFYLMHEPLSEKQENKAIKTKILFLIDTDRKQIFKKNIINKSSEDNTAIIRRIQKESDKICLFDPYAMENYEQTEIEDCLNPEKYYEAVKEVIKERKNSTLIQVSDSFSVKQGAVLSNLRGDNCCIIPNKIEMLDKKKDIIEFAEDNANKYDIALKYVELVSKSKIKVQYSLATEINRLLDV